MEIATEMARLVLAMRGSSRNEKLNQRLELLAQRFLEITGQVSESDSAGIGIPNRTPGGVTLTM